MPVNFLPQENLFLPAKKFNLSRKGVYLGSQSQPFYTTISAMLNGKMAEITR